MSKFVIPFSDLMLSYFSKRSWSRVNGGFGNIWKNAAEIFAKNNGIGTSMFFF